MILRLGCGIERRNLVHVAKVNPQDGTHQLQNYEQDYRSSTEFGLLANLFCSEGKQGKVVEVRAKCRTGKKIVSFRSIAIMTWSVVHSM